jgi:DNA-binding FrmR family transcriptional regulator
LASTEIQYVKNQINALREEMKNLLLALLESGLIEITEEDGKQVYKINKVKNG